MFLKKIHINHSAAIGLLLMTLMVFAGCGKSENIPSGTTFEVTENTELSSLTIADGAIIKAPEGKALTMIVNGIETGIIPGTYKNVELVISDKLDSNPSSYNGRGIDDYRAAIYVDKTGLVDSLSVGQAISGGTFTASSASGITVNSTSDNFNAIILNGAEYTVTDSTFSFLSKSDGSDVSDFNGFGAVIAAFNDSKVTMERVNIHTEGVARPALFADSYSDALITDSSIKVMGGTIYEGYVNTADQTKMVAPPWVLGITGNARATNMMGICSSTTVVRTDASANQWGVLSSDSGSDMLMNVVDSTLTLIGEGQDDPFSTNYGSGYGTYIIGDAQEYFYGVTFNVGTYASILTGGKGVYASSIFEDPLSIYPLEQIPNGTTVTDFMGNQSEGYDVVSSETPVFTGITGLGRNTVINSDAFGFMAHNSGSLTITDNTVVNTDNATFLMKSGDVDIIVKDGAVINANDGVILQMIDNDDSLVGADMSQGAPNFNTDFYEAEGYPGIDYDVSMTTDKRNTITFTAAGVELNGDLFNGTGYFGGQAADLLEVTLSDGASLNGAISATSIIHVDENGRQNTHFTINEYYYLGHVANRVNYNGGNDISVILENGSSWTVTGDSAITGLTIDKGAAIQAPDGSSLTMTVDGVKKPVAPGTYKGKIMLTVTES